MNSVSSAMMLGQQSPANKRFQSDTETKNLTLQCYGFTLQTKFVSWHANAEYSSLGEHITDYDD